MEAEKNELEGAQLAARQHLRTVEAQATVIKAKDGDIARLELALRGRQEEIGRLNGELARMEARAPVQSGELAGWDYYRTGFKPWSFRIPAISAPEQIMAAMQLELNDLRTALARPAIPAPVPSVNELPVELIGCAEQIADNAGFWHSCSGCHETEDGHPVGSYPHSHVFGCALGNGCSECGGLGAVWDNIDYTEMVKEIQAEEAPAAQQAVPAARELTDAEIFQLATRKIPSQTLDDGREWRCHNREILEFARAIECHLSSAAPAEGGE